MEPDDLSTPSDQRGRAPNDGETLTYVARPRSITASSRRIDPGNKEDLLHVPKKNEKWQAEAWAYYDSVPEIKFAGRFNGNALSRLRLYPGVESPDGDGPPMNVVDAAAEGLIPQKLATDALDETSRMGDTDAISGHMASFGVNLTIPGDSYMVVTPATPTEDETWQVYSESAVVRTDRGLAIKPSPTVKPELLPPDSFVIRIWRRHERWPAWADSNMRAILSEVEELLIYSRQFRAVGKSRNNAGILFLHQQLDLPQKSTDPATGKEMLTPFEASLVKSMTTPTYDDASASSVVPHIVRGNGKPDEMIKHFPLDRKIDGEAIARVTFLITRCAHGLDTPVEVLTGVADVNHWNAWQIEDQSYRMHLQPLAMVPATGLARSFLRQALIIRGNAPADVAKVCYGLDSSALTVRPNRIADAKDAFDRLAISWDAYRKHGGFSDTEAPDEEEMMQRAVMGLGLFKRSGIAEPGESVPGLPSGGGDATSGGDASARYRLAQALGLEPIERERIAIAASARVVPTRARNDLGQRLASIDVRLRDRLQIAASEAMTAALRVAGNRLRRQVQGNAVMARMVRGVDPMQVPAALGYEQALAAAGGDGSGMMDGSFDEIGWDFDAWTRQAQNQVVKLLRKYAPDEVSADEAVDRYQRHQDTNRDTAKAAFVAGLVALGSRRMFAPEAGAPGLGERSDRLSVPTGMIREALSMAGGSSEPRQGPASVPAATDVGRAGGVAMGPDALESLAVIDVDVDAWEWATGDPDHPFEPHQALDGVTFVDFADPLLTNSDAFPDEEFYWPGDHDGCECWVVAITSGPTETTEPEA